MSLLKNRYSLLKWMVLVAAYGFLAYKLLSFNQYAEVLQQWRQGWQAHAIWLLFVFILLPFNWILETIKWQFLLRKLETLSFYQALKSVMTGNTAAFFTPNRLGEFPGRTIFLSEGNRLKGVFLGILGSLSQTTSIVLCGLPAAILFFLPQHPQFGSNLNISISVCCFVMLLVLYFSLPYLCKRLSKLRLMHRIQHLLDNLTQFSFNDLGGVLFIALLRYMVFCLQFYCILNFFGVNLGMKEGAIAIATNYLFITFTPSLAFSEGAVRASAAVLVIGVYSQNIVGIAAAGLSIWLINFVLPMIAGSVFFANKKNY